MEGTKKKFWKRGKNWEGMRLESIENEVGFTAERSVIG